MDAFDPMKQATKEFVEQLASILEDMNEAEKATLEEATRGTALNRLNHPLGSSTPLPVAERLGNKSVARLEAKFGPIIQEAMTGLIAIQQAKDYSKRIEEAQTLARAASSQVSGVPKETFAAITTLHEFGASKWQWGQQSRAQLQIIADLIRWHAKDPKRTDPDNPWNVIDALYDERLIGAGKVFRPIVMNDRQSPISKAVSTATQDLHTPTRAELRKYLADDILVAPEKLFATMGGVISHSSDDAQHRPMWEREERNTSGYEATMMDWYRIEVRPGPYALMHSLKGGFSGYVPARSEWFPPYKSMRHVGVAALMSPPEVDKLEVLAEEGRGSIELALKAISYFTYNSGLPASLREHLTRYWLFLLVGRHHPSRIETLCPGGYFDCVSGPDSASFGGIKSYMTIVRTYASDDDTNQLRKPYITPWARAS